MPRRTPFHHRQGTMVNGVWTITSEEYTTAQMQAFDLTDVIDGMVITRTDGTRWMWVAAATAADTTNTLVITPTSAPTTGRWMLLDGLVDFSLPFAFGTADATALFTVPTGARLLVRRGYWEIAVALTGGTSSAIGLSSSNASFSTKGDLLGGASGDVAATLVAGVKLGTIGAKTAAGVLLVATNTVRFDAITSAFTAGSGNAHLVCDVLANPGL